MATVIRFARHGTKKKPYFRIVVQNKTAARDGRFIEHIGSFNPVKEGSVAVERDRLEYWLGTGAVMSDSVKNRVKILQKQWQGASPATAPTAPPPKKAKQAAKTKEA